MTVDYFVGGDWGLLGVNCQCSPPDPPTLSNNSYHMLSLNTIAWRLRGDFRERYEQGRLVDLCYQISRSCYSLWKLFTSSLTINHAMGRGGGGRLICNLSTMIGPHHRLSTCIDNRLSYHNANKEYGYYWFIYTDGSIENNYSIMKGWNCSGDYY